MHMKDLFHNIPRSLPISRVSLRENFPKAWLVWQRMQSLENAEVSTNIHYLLRLLRTIQWGSLFPTFDHIFNSAPYCVLTHLILLKAAFDDGLVDDLNNPGPSSASELSRQNQNLISTKATRSFTSVHLIDFLHIVNLRDHESAQDAEYQRWGYERSTTSYPNISALQRQSASFPSIIWTCGRGRTMEQTEYSNQTAAVKSDYSKGEGGEYCYGGR
jgi:hypothetical protein